MVLVADALTTITAIGVLISLIVAVAALLQARHAHREADAATDQAATARRMATIAERDFADKTEPRLRLRRLPDGSPQVFTGSGEQIVFLDKPPPPDREVSIYIENRRAAAILSAPTLNGEPGEVVMAEAVPDADAIFRFPILAIAAAKGDDHHFEVAYESRESEARGRFLVNLRRDGARWEVVSEVQEPGRDGG